MHEILIKALSLFMLVVLGAGLRRAGVLHERDFHTVSALVLNVTLPCVILVNLNGFLFEARMLQIILIGFVCAGLLTLGGYLSGRKKGREHAAFCLLNYTGYNVGCFALPFVQSFLGPAAVLTACLFDIGNALFATGGSYAIACVVKGEGGGQLVRAFLKKLLTSVPILSYILMLTLSLLRLRLPDVVLDLAGLAASANTFLAMLLLGLGLKLNFTRENLGFILKSSLFRYIAAAVFCLLVRYALPLDEAARQVLILLLLAPVSLSSIAYTGKIGGDIALSGAWISSTILVSFVLMSAALGLGVI
ncbi:MAG: AEC family transporter [Oscillospiraceae bacterium]